MERGREKEYETKHEKIDCHHPRVGGIIDSVVDVRLPRVQAGFSRQRTAVCPSCHLQGAIKDNSFTKLEPGGSKRRLH